MRHFTVTLTQPQVFLLEWLGKEEWSAYGECRSRDLDVLLALGLATLAQEPPTDRTGVGLTGSARALLWGNPEPPFGAMTDAVRDVLDEKRRHVIVEGWTPEHDDEHKAGELSAAGACYAMYATERQLGEPPPCDCPPPRWPWDRGWWKPNGVRRSLVKACSLLLAEIEKIDRFTDEQDRAAPAAQRPQLRLVEPTSEGGPR